MDIIRCSIINGYYSVIGNHCYIVPSTYYKKVLTQIKFKKISYYCR